MKRFHVQPLFDIRWRLDYSDGTHPKWGQWTRPMDDPKQMASFQKRNNIARAFIEVRNKRTFETRRPVTCEGWDFVMFKWEYAASIAGGIGKGSYTPTPQVTGMMLVTRDFETVVRVDGSPILTRRRKKEERDYNYACFGK